MKRPHFIPQLHKNVASLLSEISLLDGERQVLALRQCRPLRALAYFALGPFELDLPTSELSIDVIGPTAFVQDRDSPPDEDPLAYELETTTGGNSRLVRLFAKNVHPTLTSKKRLELWKSIVGRCNAQERQILENCRYRRFPISREVIELAWPGLLSTLPAKEPTVEQIQYPPSMFVEDWDGPRITPTVPAAQPLSEQSMTEGERHYAEMMRRMWG